MTDDAPRPTASAATAPTPSCSALIDRLAELLERSDLTELEVESGGTGLILRKPVADRRRPSAAAAVGAAPRPPARQAGSRRRAVDRRPRSRTAGAAVGQGAADRHLLRLAGAGLGAVRPGRWRGRGRPGHRPHRGDEAVQRDQVGPRRPRRPGRARRAARWSRPSSRSSRWSRCERRARATPTSPAGAATPRARS